MQLLPYTQKNTLFEGKNILFTGLSLFFSFYMIGCHTTASVSFVPASEATQIRSVLNTQVEAWNQGDIEGFMQGYARTDSLRFASGGNVRYGWQTTFESYQKGYPDREAMGTLLFENLDIQVLSPTWAMVFGGWRLKRTVDEPHGLFTLVLEKQKAGWVVVHDHTSSAE